jgi:hypothetical protein
LNPRIHFCGEYFVLCEGFVRRRGPGAVEAFEVLQVISSQNEAINVAADQPRDEETTVEGTKACQMAARSIRKAWRRGKGKT